MTPKMTMVKGLAVSGNGSFGAVHYGDSRKDNVRVFGIESEHHGEAELAHAHPVRTSLHVNGGGFCTIIDGDRLLRALSPNLRIISGRLPYPEYLRVMAGHRLVYAEEPRKSASFNDGLLKDLSAGGPQTGRRLRENLQQFDFGAKLFFLCNHLPHLDDTGRGIKRRVCVIPFGKGARPS